MKKNKISIIVNFKFLMQYAKEYKASFLNFYLGMLFISVVDMLSPILLGLLIDEVLYYKSVNHFLRLAFMYTMMILYQGLTYFVAYHNQHYLNSVYVLKIRYQLFNKVLNAKASFLSHIKAGALATVVDEYTDYCLHFIVRNFIHFFNNILVSVWCTWYIYRINIAFGVCVSVIVVIQVCCMLYNNKKIKAIASTQRELYGNHLGYLMSILENLRDIQLLSVPHYICGKVRTNFYQYKENENAVAVKKFWVTELVKFLNVVLLLMIYAMAALLIYHDQIQLGTFLVIITYYNTLTKMILFTTTAANLMGENVSMIDSIRNVSMEETEKTKGGVKDCSFREDIEFRKVSFAYGNKMVLRQVSCIIPFGTKIGIVGASGCGKSTMMALLMGFYSAQEGAVRLGAHDIQEIDLSALRKNIGVVHQDVLIYTDTIRNNLLMANPGATEEEIKAAVKAACLEGFIAQLPEGLDTVIQKGGKTISGGQLQRIAIARLFLKGVSIVVCDEATSALDIQTEKNISDAILSAFQEKTVITISHRFSTLLQCDKVIVLKEGEIVQWGAPRELIQEKGEFRSLFAPQLGEWDVVHKGV